MGWKDAPIVEDEEEKKPAWMSAPEVDEEPSLPEKKEPAWYDIGGKVGKTIDDTKNRIDTVNKKYGDSNIVGPALNALHMASGGIRAAGDVLSPIVDNPVVKKTGSLLLEGFGNVGNDNRNASRLQSQKSGIPQTVNKPINLQPVKEFVERHPIAVDAVKSGIDVAGAIPAGKVTGKIANEGAGLVADALKGSGLKIQNVTAKISQRGAKEGAKIETIPKYNLWGNATKIQEKSQDLIKSKASELKNAIQNANGDPRTQVNIYDVMNDSYKDMIGSTTFDRDRIRSVYNKAMEDIADRFGGNTSNMDLADAQMLKREVGKRGDWVDAYGKRSGNPDAGIEAQVYNDIYNNLKNKIENVGPPEIKIINKELSELIPLERDMARRSLVEKRNEIIPLKEYIGVIGALGSGNPAVLGMVAAQQAAKTPTVGKLVYNVGSTLEKAKNKKIF